MFTNQSLVQSSIFISLKNINNLVIIKSLYNRCAINKNSFKIHDVIFPLTLSKAVSKRQAEYLAGRITAKLALKKLNIETYDIPIGENRCPIWPTDVIASISHTHDQAFCAAAYKKDYKYLGIDIENWIKISLINKIKQQIINGKEEKLLSNDRVIYQKLFTIVFSVKESLFKALYPSVRYYFDFSAVEVINICHELNEVTLELCQSLSIDLPKGTQFIGYFKCYQNSVFTLIAAKEKLV